MASYPLSPVALSTIDSLTPSDLENASKLGEALRQTRYLIKTLLQGVMNDDGTLKSIALLAANSVSTVALIDACVTAAKLANAAVTTAALADASVQTAKLVDLAVSTAKIADLAITTIKLADNAVTTAKILDKNVTGAKIANDAAVDANRAITTDHIKDNSIVERCLANLAVSMAKLKPTAASSMIWDDGAAVNSYPVDSAGDIVPAIVSGKVKFTFPPGKGTLFGAMALVVETGGPSANAGGIVKDTWTSRPAGAGAGNTDFHVIYDPSGIFDPNFVVEIESGNNKKRFLFLTAGTYYVRLSVAGYKVGSQAARLVDKTAGATVLMETGANNVAGTSDSTQDFSIGEKIITIPVANTHVQLEQFCSITNNTDGLGTPMKSSVGGFPLTTNTYMYMFVVKLS